MNKGSVANPGLALVAIDWGSKYEIPMKSFCEKICSS